MSEDDDIFLHLSRPNLAIRPAPESEACEACRLVLWPSFRQHHWTSDYDEWAFSLNGCHVVAPPGEVLPTKDKTP